MNKRYRSSFEKETTHHICLTVLSHLLFQKATEYKDTSIYILNLASIFVVLVTSFTCKYKPTVSVKESIKTEFQAYSGEE